MSVNPDYFIAEDGKKISYYRWMPDKEINGTIVIAHGMAEHSGRYNEFASFLNQNGFAVFANDHRGHGKTAGIPENVGFVAEKNGWELMVNDFLRMKKIARTCNPEAPLFAFGHSMGTFIIRDAVLMNEGVSSDIAGIILSGTGCGLGLIGLIGRILFKLEVSKRGAAGKSQLLHNISFGKYNKNFKDFRTEYDWLSADRANVDKYIEDPFCGTVFSASFFRDLAYAIEKVNSLKNIKKIRKNLPVFLISGEEDPVGNFTRGVIKVFKDYKRAGINDIQLKFYKGFRHEILNESKKEEVYQDILKWLKAHIA